MEVEITVDGEEIPMNEFVQSIIAGMVRGAVETLDGVDSDWKDLSIKLKQ